MSSFSLIVSCLLVLTVSPLHGKLLNIKRNEDPCLKTLFENSFLTQLTEDNKKLFHDVVWNLLGNKRNMEEGQTLQEALSHLGKTPLNFEAFTDFVENTIGVNQNLLKFFLKAADKIRYLKNRNLGAGNSCFEKFAAIFLNKFLSQGEEEMTNNINEETAEINSAATFQSNLFEMIMNSLDGKLDGLSSTLVPLMPHTSTEMASLNSTYSSIWMIVKSTWQRLLAYVEDENSLETFMQLTPVRIMDSIISLGDDLNLMNFLAKKLDKDLAEFVAGEINPYLGPLKDFDTFYNFTKENGFNGIIDYFTSERFTYTINAMSKFISAYLEDTVSDDLVNQYIEFISFNNTELLNFYKSVLRSQEKILSPDSTSDTIGGNTTHRLRRDVLEDIASTFVKSPESEHTDSTEHQTKSGRQFNQRFGAINNMGYANSMYDPSRDGGYGGYGGGGGYGHGGYGMNMGTLDPYVVLGALALGTILGFLIFRALRGTRNGRRDIGDGSLSLWDSDLPDQMLPSGADSSLQRMKRDVHDDTQGFSLPQSFRGDVWSSDPLVADDLLDDHLHEDDIVHHLNHLWRLYRDTNETACVQSHLCDVMANTTAQHLTGKHFGLSLVMASLGNLMGVIGSGQLMDDVTHSLVVGNPYTCPSLVPCHQM